MQRDRRIEAVRARAARAGGGAYFSADGAGGMEHWIAATPTVSPGGAGGVVLSAISGVDPALWDLHVRAYTRVGPA